MLLGSSLHAIPRLSIELVEILSVSDTAPNTMLNEPNTHTYTYTRKRTYICTHHMPLITKKENFVKIISSMRTPYLLT